MWYVSSVVRALRTADLASVSWAFVRWFRNAGRAIAARIPMIRITTSSSTSVKPRWSRKRRDVGGQAIRPINGM